MIEIIFFMFVYFVDLFDFLLPLAFLACLSPAGFEAAEDLFDADDFFADELLPADDVLLPDAEEEDLLAGFGASGSP